MGILFKAEDFICIYTLGDVTLKAVLTHLNVVDCTCAKYSSKWQKKKNLLVHPKILQDNLAEDYLGISSENSDLALNFQIK